MRRFSEYDPIVAAVYFLTVAGAAMFCNYPPLTALTLLGGVLYSIVLKSSGKTHFYFFMLFTVLALANPLVSHNGVTVLFVMNDNPVTLEALLYGINSAAMIIGVLYWFRCFTKIMTSDKLLYITGSLSPKLSLVISMSLRFVPLFRKQWGKVRDAQKAMGLFNGDNIIDDIKGNMRIFSIIITWALENGIATADSMEARGYGVCRRSHFSNFRMCRSDIILLVTELGLFGVCASAIGAGRMDISFYPAISCGKTGVLGMAGLVCYGILVMLPVIIETEASLRWKYLKSKI